MYMNVQYKHGYCSTIIKDALTLELILHQPCLLLRLQLWRTFVPLLPRYRAKTLKAMPTLQNTSLRILFANGYMFGDITQGIFSLAMGTIHTMCTPLARHDAD